MTIVEKHGHRRSERASVWFAIPSARPVAEAEKCLREWRERGYKIALMRDVCDMEGDLVFACQRYPGYAISVNLLAAHIVEFHPEADWIVTGGDDTYPHPDKSAAQIAEECNEHFADLWSDRIEADHYREVGMTPPLRWQPETTAQAETFGVMQPTGDRWAGGHIDRIAGSPWLGREWCLRANGGRGPFWPAFTHMFGDEALLRTAEKVGVYWRRPDLMHFHRHFKRADESLHADAANLPCPPHLVKWNTREHWDEMKAIFKRLEREGFAPCMPK